MAEAAAHDLDEEAAVDQLGGVGSSGACTCHRCACSSCSPRRWTCPPGRCLPRRACSTWLPPGMGPRRLTGPRHRRWSLPSAATAPWPAAPAPGGLAGAQARRPGPRHPRRRRGLAADPLRDGGPRSRPRDPATVINHMNYARPALLAWSSQYGHLREVTRNDVLAVLGELHGSRRSNVLVALRSLFASCKRRKAVFRSPVQGIRVGERARGTIQPLSQDEVDQAAEAAATPSRPAGPGPRRDARRPVQGDPPDPPQRRRPRQPENHHRQPGPPRSTTSPARSCSSGSPTGPPAGPPRPTRT